MKKIISGLIVMLAMTSFTFAATPKLVNSSICTKKYPGTLLRTSDKKCVCSTGFPLRRTKKNQCRTSKSNNLVAQKTQINIDRIPRIIISGSIINIQIIGSGLSQTGNTGGINTGLLSLTSTVLLPINVSTTNIDTNSELNILPDLELVQVDTGSNVKKITVKNVSKNDYVYDPKLGTFVLYCVGEDNRAVIHTRLPFGGPLYDQTSITIKGGESLTFESSPAIIDLFPQNQQQKFACIVGAPVDYYVSQDGDRFAYDRQYQTMNARAQQYFGHSIKRFDYGTSFVFWDTQSYCNKYQYTNTKLCKGEKSNTTLESNYSNNIYVGKLFD